MISDFNLVFKILWLIFFEKFVVIKIFVRSWELWKFCYKRYNLDYYFFCNVRLIEDKVYFVD